MSEILFIGGPWHGRVVDVKDDVEMIQVPVPAGQRSTLDPTGLPILSSMDSLPYARRRFTAPSGRYREVFAAASLPPPAAMQALADVLIALWVESGPEPEPVPDDLKDLLKAANARKPVAQDESGRAGGPAATLAGDQ